MILDVKENNYYINIGFKIDSELISYLNRYKKNKIAVIADEYVYSIYENRIKKMLSGFKYNIFTFPQGEENKSIRTYEGALKFLSNKNYDRGDLIIGFGGGITGDISAFVASSYLRGTNYIAIPTTLLSMIDSSVGGKTAINFNGFKNQVGSFYFPSYVHIDYSFLETLDGKNFNSGLAELYKYAVLYDKDLFFNLNKKREDMDLEELIHRALEIKLDFVRGDERDRGKRQFLNLGHTIGHGIEALSNYEILHGEAVAIGIVYMARAGYKMGLSKDIFYKDIIKAFNGHKLKTDFEFDTEEIAGIIMHDKKIKDGRINLIIPIEIGKAINKEVSFEELKEIINLGKNNEGNSY